MSLEISIARRAEQDMTLQYRWYLDNADFAVAERYLLAVDETIQSIAAQPDLGIRRHFAAPELASIQHPASSLAPISLPPKISARSVSRFVQEQADLSHTLGTPQEPLLAAQTVLSQGARSGLFGTGRAIWMVLTSPPGEARYNRTC